MEEKHHKNFGLSKNMYLVVQSYIQQNKESSLIEKKRNDAEKKCEEEKKFMPAPFLNLNEDEYILPTILDDFEGNDDIIIDTNVHSGHRMFDMHGYTVIGTEQAVRAILTSVDRSRQNVIKINVGQGIHSQGGVGKLSDIVKKVAKDLQLPDPVRHAKNPGYLLMILPAIISSD